MATTVRPTSDARLDVLDGMRGIAILMVVWWHLWLFSWLSPYFNLWGHQFNLLIVPGTGGMGVEVFFFISGFVLFYPYARHMFEGKKLQTVKEFAYRRFIKIVPSYIIALVAAMLLLGNFASWREVLWQGVTHLFFIHSFWLDTWVGVNGVLWSLAVEVQFYLFFPLLCWAFRRWPPLVYLAMAGGAMLYRAHYAGCCIGDYVVMNQMPAYLDLFASGMLASWFFVLLRNKIPDIERFRPLATLVAAGAFAGIYAMLNNLLQLLYVQNGYYAWQAHNRTYLGALLAVFAVAACLSYPWLRAIIANKFFLFLGIISYNLYLWHNVIMLWMLHHRIPSPLTPDPHYDDHWKWQYTAWSLVVSVGVSSAITYFIERPLLKKGFRAITDLFTRRPIAPTAAPAPAPASSDG
jgi:peptidoglycan/LPS O-acetylase OafA/YrhL